METKSPELPTPEELARQVAQLQQALAAAEFRAEKAKSEWSLQYDLNHTLRERNRHLEHEYEQLRLQKGGFGFKMLLFTAVASALFALLGTFVYLKLRPKDAHTVAFEQFRRDHLFRYELALSEGQFDSVEQSLREEAAKPDNQVISAEIEFARQLVTTAKRRCK